MGLIIQIGAGIGNDHVSKFNGPKNDLILIEANPLHIKALGEHYSQAHVMQCAIVPSYDFGKKIVMYYSVDDAPEYQVTSTSLEHVLKHGYSIESIRVFQTPTMTLDQLLSTVDKHVDYLFIDIEGLDEHVLIDTDLSKHSIDKIQVEMLHIENKQRLLDHMEKQGFRLTEDTLDTHRYDRIFERTK